MLVYFMIYNDMEFYLPFEIKYVVLLSFDYILFVECYLTPSGRLVDRLPISMNE
jgi:hypothetical protein